MASKIKTDPESSIYFLKPSDVGLVPSGDSSATFNPSNLPAGSGHNSTLYDLGPGPRTTLFEWRSVAQLSGGSGNPGTSVEQYLACSNDGTLIDGMIPGVDSGLQNPDQRRNLDFMGALTEDGNSTLVSSGRVHIFSRYVSVVWWNSTPNALGPSGNLVILTPMPDELQ
jgi:hypothetical protein